MIALIVALLCVRFILAALGAVLGFLISGIGLTAEVAWVGARWVLWPALVLVARAVRRLTVGPRSGPYTSNSQRTAPPSVRGPRTLVQHAALLAGIRAARV